MTQTPPDPTAASREEGFAAWLAMNDYLVEDEFLVFDVEDMPEDPFTAEGLRVAEAAALAQFDSPREALAPGNRELYDKFIRFLGETFVRSVGGEWTCRPTVDDGRPYIGVRFPWRDETLEIPTLVTAAMARRTGDEWAFVHRNLIMRRDASY